MTHFRAAKKYPYDGGNYEQGIRNSPIQMRADSKSWLQQKLEEELGPNVLYLITGPGILVTPQLIIGY